MISDAKIICERLDKLFVHKQGVRYWLQIVDDPYDQTYNFFFESRSKGHRERSVPLHTVARYDLVYFEQLIDQITSHTQLMITYVGFTGQKWPETQRMIQKKEHWNE